jgi:hypothetical protein
MRSTVRDSQTFASRLKFISEQSGVGTDRPASFAIKAGRPAAGSASWCPLGSGVVPIAVGGDHRISLFRSPTVTLVRASPGVRLED